MGRLSRNCKRNVTLIYRECTVWCFRDEGIWIWWPNDNYINDQVILLGSWSKTSEKNFFLLFIFILVKQHFTSRQCIRVFSLAQEGQSWHVLQKIPPLLVIFVTFLLTRHIQNTSKAWQNSVENILHIWEEDMLLDTITWMLDFHKWCLL